MDLQVGAHLVWEHHAYSYFTVAGSSLAFNLSPALPGGRVPEEVVNGADMSNGDTWLLALSVASIIVVAVAVASRSILKELHRSR